MISRYKIVLFDLDGTLCESGEGILNSAKHAIQAVGFPVPPPEIMRKFIGPPMGQSLQNFCGMDKELAEKAVAIYRERYNRIGWIENRLYPGIQELLKDLKASGAKLYYRANGKILYAETDGAITPYTYNGHGDVVRAGSKSYQYDAFGNQLITDETDTNPFRYAGEYYDGETGNIYDCGIIGLN